MNGPKTHRLFFALDPDDEVRREVAGWQRKLGIEGRAVPPPNFHVTLAFLGMQPEALIPAVCEVAEDQVFRRCDVLLDKPGQFKRAGVMWLGSNELPATLVRFQHELVGGLLEAGIGYDRKPWKFHLTLYRKMRNRPEIMPPVGVRWRLDGFSLIESVSIRSGVEYHTLGRWNAID